MRGFGYENKSPTTWNGYIITEPAPSRTEPTVFEVEFVTRFVVCSACPDAQPGVMKTAPANSKAGRIRLIFDI